MDYIHLKFWPDPIAASDSRAEQGGEEAKKRACPLPHTWWTTPWSSTPTPSPTSRSSFSKSQYLSRTCSFLSSLSIFSGNPGNFEPLRDDDSEGPGVMVDGDHEVAYDGKAWFWQLITLSGPGMKGEAYHTKPDQAAQVDEAIDRWFGDDSDHCGGHHHHQPHHYHHHPPSYGMNMVASNEISLDRSLPDTRMSECKDWHYPAELPKVDIFVLQVQN